MAGATVAVQEVRLSDAQIRRQERVGDWAAVLAAMGRERENWRWRGACVHLRNWSMPIERIFPGESGWLVYTTLGTTLEAGDPRIVGVSLTTQAATA